MRFEGYHGDISSIKLLNACKFFKDLQKKTSKRASISSSKLRKYLSLAESAAMIIDYRKTGPRIMRMIKKRHPDWERPRFRHIVSVMMNELLEERELKTILTKYRLEIAEEVCGYLRTYILNKQREEREREKEDILAIMLKEM